MEYVSTCAVALRVSKTIVPSTFCACMHPNMPLQTSMGLCPDRLHVMRSFAPEANVPCRVMWLGPHGTEQPQPTGCPFAWKDVPA